MILYRERLFQRRAVHGHCYRAEGKPESNATLPDLIRHSLDTEDIAATIRALLAAANVQVNRPAVEAGLSMLESNGDFADGVIAYERNWLGGDVFVSFDKHAVAFLTEQGKPARLL